MLVQPHPYLKKRHDSGSDLMIDSTPGPPRQGRRHSPLGATRGNDPGAPDPAAGAAAGHRAPRSSLAPRTGARLLSDLPG